MDLFRKLERMEAIFQLPRAGIELMSDKILFTEKNLKDWAGWRAFRDGKSLFTRGVVEKVTYEHPLITGTLNLGPRGMRSKFKVLDNGLVDNLCPCRDNQERGLICSHLVAMGMEVIRRNADPVHKEKAHGRPNLIKGALAELRARHITQPLHRAYMGIAGFGLQIIGVVAFDSAEMNFAVTF